MINTAKKIRVAMIGLGGMGIRWAQVVKAHPFSVLSVVSSRNFEKASAVARDFGCNVYRDWREIVQDKSIDAVVIATPHFLLTEIAQAALSAGKHVFCEKPGGISSVEIQKGVDIAEKKHLHYRVNYNMRLHSAVVAAKQKFDSGAIGPVMFIRGILANSGRENFEQEWRCNKKISGGGNLIDQGAHLIDIANWFFGPVVSISAFLQTAFWNIKPLEDNSFIILKNANGNIASLHASWTHWDKTFRIEVYGKEGYLVMEGLGGQYGTERLIFGKRTFGREAPQEEILEFPSFIHGKPSSALINSWDEFMRDVLDGSFDDLDAKNAVRIYKVIEAAYRSDKEKAIINLHGF